MTTPMTRGLAPMHHAVCAHCTIAVAQIFFTLVVSTCLYHLCLGCIV